MCVCVCVYIYIKLCLGKMRLQFWEMELNKGEDELSSPGMPIHLSQSTELYHQEQALFHRLMTAEKVPLLARLCIINVRKDGCRSGTKKKQEE